MTFTTWADVPLMFRVRQDAALMDISYDTARHQVSRGLCEVPPALVKPYRWRKEDVRRYIETSTVVDDRRRKSRRAA